MAQPLGPVLWEQWLLTETLILVLVVALVVWLLNSDYWW